MRAARLLCLTAHLLVPASAMAQQSAPVVDGASADSVRIERLAGLGRVWGTAKYFHPALAFRPTTEWDAALVATIPRVREARSAEEYAAAVQAMLDELDDPLTRVVGLGELSGDVPEERSAAADAFGYRWTADSILVVTAGDYNALFQPSVGEQLGEAALAIPSARAIVIDLRSVQPASGYGRYVLERAFGDLERLLTSDTLSLAAEWRRVYYGFEGASPFASGQYRTGSFVEAGSRQSPAPNAGDAPVVFVLNENAGALPVILPLQAAGKALIVFEGDPRRHGVGDVRTVELAEGLTARVRESVPVLPDGTSGEFRPDVVVQAASGAGASDPAIEKSLLLARDFGPSTVARTKLPASILAPREASYGEMEYPDLAYRLLAAFRIWNAIEYFYPYKDLLDEEWAAVLPELLPAFENATDAREYVLAVAEMAARVQDSHSYIGGTVYNEQVLGAGYPPIRVRMIEGQPVVTALKDTAAARRAGVEVGDVVVAVDGEAADVRLARTATYFSASTPQSRMDKAALSFMSGPIGSSVTLVLRDGSGAETVATLERRPEDYTTLYHRERDGEIVRVLPGNVGYVDLDRLTYDMVEPMFEQLADTRAIIFDMRGYPYGTVWAIAPRLADSVRVAALFETPMVGQRSPAPSVEAFEQIIQPDGPRYTGRTAMLMDERTQSQAEHTGLWLKAANGTLFVGSPTVGANGEVTAITVPGGMAVGFTGQAVTFPDGSQLQRIGLTPDVRVAPTIEGIRSSRDEVLEAALRLLVVTAGDTEAAGAVSHDTEPAGVARD